VSEGVKRVTSNGRVDNTDFTAGV